MQATTIERILERYQLTPIRIHPPQSGYRNHAYALELADGQTANLILYKSEPGILTRIQCANAVGDGAADQELPARHTSSPRIIQLRAGAKIKYGALYHYLPGHTIPWEAYTMKHLKLLGLSLGRLHTALRTLLPPPGLPDAEAEYGAILRRMQAYFEQPGVQSALGLTLGLKLDPGSLQPYHRLLTHCATQPDRQILHLDFVRSNLLFRPATPTDQLQLDGLALSGILDFEKTALGHPVFDLARTLAFLLVDCKFKTSAQIIKYFIYSGYQKRGGQELKSPQVHHQLMAPLTNLFLLHDFYKFLRHNPYQSLHQNQHYRRTQTLLLQRGLLRPALSGATIAVRATSQVV